MSDFMKMDVFFVVSTLGIALAIACGIVLCYLLWRILRSVQSLVRDVSEIVSDAKEVSASIKKDITETSSKFGSTIASVIRIIGFAKKSSKKRSSK